MAPFLRMLSTRKRPPTVSNMRNQSQEGKSQHDLSNADQPFLNGLYDPQDPQLWADRVKTLSVFYSSTFENKGAMVCTSAQDRSSSSIGL